MRRIVGVFVLAIFAILPSMAQEMSESEVSALMTEAFMLNKDGKYEEALSGFLKVAENTKRQRTEPEREMYVCSQTMAAMCYEYLKRFEEGFALSKQLLQENLNDKERIDVQHLYVVNGYCIGMEYMGKRNKRYHEARELFEEILPFADDNLRRRILPKIPMAYYFEGIGYQATQKYDLAMPCMEKARQGFHEVGETKNVIDALCQIGSMKSFMYDVAGAMATYREAQQLAERIQDEVSLMAVMKELRKICQSVGDTERSIALNAKMDSLVVNTDNKKIKFEYYCQKGREAKDQGNYNLAEQWYLKNVPYIQQLDNNYLGADKHLHYTYLRDLYAKARRFDESLEYAELSKQTFQRSFDKTDNSYYMPYMAIANIHQAKGDSVNCFRNLDSLFVALDRMDEPKEIYELYVTRARCHAAFKNYELALNDYRTADSVLATKYGKEDGERIILLPLIGGIEHRLKHFEESERLYKEYVERVEILLGENSVEYIDALTYLANAEGFAGHIEAGCRDYATATGMLKKQVRQRLPYLTTAERESYWRPIAEVMQKMTPFALEAKEEQSAFTASCYDGLVLSKAFLLESERSTFDVIKRYGMEDDEHTYMTIASMQQQIKSLSRNEALYADSILFLTTKVGQMETKLAKRCREYGNVTTFMEVDYQKVKSALKDNEVLIDFTDYVSESKGRMYAAYLIANKQQYPLLKRLFAECSIDSLGIPYPDMYYEEPHSKELLKMLWEPFKNDVAEGSTVYYVPSQMLFQVALESLTMEDGTLLGDHYRFVRLSSAREVANASETKSINIDDRKTNAVLYGGLQYDLKPSEMAEEAAKYDISPLLAMRGEPTRGDSIYRELPESKKEIESITNTLRGQRMSVKPYTGMNGTEESFLSMRSDAPQILHVATHGFYYTPDAASEIDYLRGYTDAMSLSGLVMSGGNAAWRGQELPEGVLGGILTAVNIAQLDFTGMEMVVLSACKSGRGNATPEGLFGLQRAFKKAGAQTMVMTLWNVSDVVAKEFMIRFYDNLVKDGYGWNKRKAFNDAKQYIRGKYPEPFYWAGFVMLD